MVRIHTGDPRYMGPSWSKSFCYCVKKQFKIELMEPKTTKKPTEELIVYLTDMGYEIGFLELYVIQPKNFPPVRNNPDLDI